MPNLSLRKNCKWCQAIKQDKKLLKRLYASNAYVRGGESLRSIALDMEMQYPSLRKHVKYHQALTDDELDSAKLERIAKQTSKQLIHTNIRTTDARQSVIDKMMQKFEEGDFDEDMSIKDFLRVMKDSDDVKAKAKDQDIDIMRMMQGLRSGEVGSGGKRIVIEGETVEKEFDPWAIEA